MENIDRLPVLVDRLEQLKAGKKSFDEPIRAVEKAIAELVGSPTDGTQTVHTDTHKVAVSHRPKRVIDLDEYDLIKDECPGIAGVVRTKREIDVSALKKLAISNPQSYSIVAQVITTTPTKPSVSIKITGPADV